MKPLLEEALFYSIFSLLLIKQIFEKKKSLRAASKSWTQFWPRINPYLCYRSEICTKMRISSPPNFGGSGILFNGRPFYTPCN